VDADPVMPEAAVLGFADAMMGDRPAPAAVRRRLVLSKVSLAETAVAVSGGRSLAPGWPVPTAQHEPTLPLTPITP
jgi:hypothetical protein